MDPLSEVFSALRIDAAVTTVLEASAPWGWRSTGSPASRVNFVLVQSGAGLLYLPERQGPVELAAGDVFVLLDGDPYILADSPDTSTVDCEVVERNRIDGVISFGGGGAVTTFISGAFAIAGLDGAPLASVLPRFLHLRLGKERSESFEAALKLLALEVRAPGLASEATIARIYGILFVHAVRAYLHSGAVAPGGWIAAMSDPQLAPSVRAMHADLRRRWSLEELAASVHMSRSAYAARFRTVVGQPPLTYLAHARMQRARLLLRDTQRTHAQIADDVGYESESSFSRVFKRITGHRPGVFRERAV